MSATTNTVKALETFFGGFGIPVYAEDSVPDTDASGAKVAPPYVTVQLVVPNWRTGTPFYARVWYRASDFEAIAAKVDEIEAAIGEGVGIPTGAGAVYIFPGTPFCQFQPLAGDITLKCAYLNMTLMAHTN